MSGGIQHNAPQVAAKYRSAAARVNAELARSLDGLAARAAALMRTKAPKGARSTLTNSIIVSKFSDLDYVVAPGVAYAYYVEKGRKPGKGLPRFFDPASASVVAWLQFRLDGAARAVNPKWRPGRIGSKRRTAAELELRDRYMGLSRHVKLHGIKAQPFVKPTADEMLPLFRAELAATVKRAAQAAGLQITGTATGGAL